LKFFQTFNPLSAKKSKVQSKSDSIPARALLFGFAVSYHFPISITGGFAFGHLAVLLVNFCS